MTPHILLPWIAWFLLGSWAFFALKIMLYASEQPAGERARALRGILIGLIDDGAYQARQLDILKEL